VEKTEPARWARFAIAAVLLAAWAAGCGDRLFQRGKKFKLEHFSMFAGGAQ
jgi:hypothetical protein